MDGAQYEVQTSMEEGENYLERYGDSADISTTTSSASPVPEFLRTQASECMNTLPTTHDSNTPSSIDLLHNRDTLPQPFFLNQIPPIFNSIELNALAIISTAKRRWMQIERILTMLQT